MKRQAAGWLAVAWLASMCLVAYTIPGPTANTQGTLSIQGGDAISKFRQGQFSMDLDSMLAATTLDAKVYVPGIDLAGNWWFSISPLTAMSDGLGVDYARCTANDTIQIRFRNVCGQGVNNPPMSFKWVGLK